MYYMFYYCSSLTILDVSNFDTSQVTDMGYMFAGCSNITGLDLSSFNTAKVNYMVRMFSGCTSLEDLDLSNASFESLSSISNYADVFALSANSITIKVKDEAAKSVVLAMLDDSAITNGVVLIA